MNRQNVLRLAADLLSVALLGALFLHRQVLARTNTWPTSSSTCRTISHRANTIKTPPTWPTRRSAPPRSTAAWGWRNSATVSLPKPGKATGAATISPPLQKCGRRRSSSYKH